MAAVSVTTPFNIDLEFNVASPGKRVLAFLIDGVIMVIYRWTFNLVILDYLPDSEGIRYAIIALFLVLPLLLYHFLMEVFFHGQSIGKRLMHIRVVNFLGNEASVSQYLIRMLFRATFIVPLVAGIVATIFYEAGSDFGSSAFYIVYMVLLLLAGLGTFLYFVLSKYGQRIGDTLANTLVIEDRAKADFHKTIYLEIADTSYAVKYPEVMRLTDRDINGIRNLLDVRRITKEQEAYMRRIALRIQDVLGITTQLEPYDFLAQLLRDYNFLTSR